MGSKLSDHIFKKGKFVTPWNNVLGGLAKMQSWSMNRLPEYLWIALILYKYDRNIGLKKLILIMDKLSEIDTNISVPAFSLINKLKNNEQKSFFSYIAEVTDKEALSPLTIIYTYSDYTEFSKVFCDPKIPLPDRQKIITDVMNASYNHQSQFATDVRFLVLYFSLLKGNKCMLKEELDLFIEYPMLDHTDEKMRMIRPMIRSTEMLLMHLELLDEQFLEEFWRRISKMSDCKLFYINFPKNTYNSERYTELLYEILQFLSECLKASAPLDKKMLVLLGIATYSYKRVKEIVDHDLYNSITARGTVRTIIENYIMMKYLILNEVTQNDIWNKFQYYGIGLYKIILARSREVGRDLSTNHIDYRYLEILVNEYMDEEYIDMDTSYFDKQNIRDKATIVGEKELYGLYYDYDSSFEHGLWGAIRESSLLKCDSPEHQFHCVPDYESKQNMKNVWPDCVMVMNKIVTLLNELYGVPNYLFNEVIKFEK